MSSNAHASVRISVVVTQARSPVADYAFHFRTCEIAVPHPGAIDWAPLLPRLFSKCLWAFQVPVGTASAAPPFGEASLPCSYIAVAYSNVTTDSNLSVRVLPCKAGMSNKNAFMGFLLSL